MINQTRLKTDARVPARFELPDELVSWDLHVPDYQPPIYPAFSVVKKRLRNKGVDVATAKDLRHLATLTNNEAIDVFGETVLRIRNPLGRTGINGTGALWEAGPSGPADMAITRDHPEAGRQIALVFNRGAWRTPGGFPRPSEKLHWRLTALREAHEEVGLDLLGLAVDGHIHTLKDSSIKENSRRSADLAYIANSVALIHLPEYQLGDAIQPRSDAKDAGWFTRADVQTRFTHDLMSKDHYAYAIAALDFDADSV